MLTRYFLGLCFGSAARRLKWQLEGTCSVITIGLSDPGLRGALSSCPPALIFRAPGIFVRLTCDGRRNNLGCFCLVVFGAGVFPTPRIEMKKQLRFVTVIYEV